MNPRTGLLIAFFWWFPVVFVGALVAWVLG